MKTKLKLVSLLLLVGVASAAETTCAQTLVDLRTGNPVLGTNDIFQLSTNGNQQLTGAPFNYFTDNPSPPGQTFTVGTNSMLLTSLAIKTGLLPLDSGGGGLGPQQYELQLFLVSGSNATLIPNASYYSSSSFSYADGDWLQWTGLSVGLAANTTYAYSFRRVNSGYDGLAVASENPYSGGEVVLIPNGGGTMTYQGSHSFDAVFDIGLSVPTIHEPANDNHIIYDEQTNLAPPALNNGWQNWGYNSTLNFTNTAPVRNGSNISISAVMPNGSRIHLVHSAMDVSFYGSFTFWANGGTTGGQQLEVSASNNGGTGTLVGIGPLQANSWQQITVSLAALGVAEETNLTDLWIINNNGSSLPVFYLSDLALVAGTPPVTVHVNVNALNTLQTVDARVFGINAAYWDSYINTPTTINILTNMNNEALRWPGGSGADNFFMTNASDFASTANFIQVATNTHAQVYFTVNYGTGTPEQAADWVRYCNVTNHCGFKYWEVGNESGGSWETDSNTIAPWQPHDPWTYAMRFQQYYTAMKAVDPTIKIGSSADVTEDGTSNYTNHPVVNPRTHLTHNGWTPVMLYTMLTNGCICDFLIDHTYGPGNSDTADLTYSTIWTVNANNLRQMLVDYIGSLNANVELDVTENGSGGNDRQMVSLVSSLFWADSVGQILQTEFKSRLWWDLRNGQANATPGDNTLYGWRQNSSGNYYGDLGIVTGLGDTAINRYPAYYAGELMKYFAGGGDKSVIVTSDYKLLSAYAVRRTNGILTLLVINKSCYANLNATINIVGFVPSTNATVYSYGIAQDQAAFFNGSATMQDVSVTNLTATGTNFTATFPPYTATVLQFAPAGYVSSFTATPPSGFVPATVTFNDNSTGNITNRHWVFGDGGTLDTMSAIVSHTYNTAGTNIVMLIVSGPNGGGTNTLEVTTVTPDGGAYQAAVLANAPAAFYELNETNDPATGDTVAYDYAGGNNGTYGRTVQNGYNNIAGPRPVSDAAPGFSSNNMAAQFNVNTANSQITLPALNLDNDSITITAWLKPLPSQNSWAGIVFSRAATTVAGLSYTATQSGGNYTLGYNWNNDPGVWGWNSGLVVPPGQWSLVALIVNPTNATIYVINTNGLTYAAHTYAHVVQNFDGNTLIGDDSADGGDGGRGFNGTIDDVAIFRTALSSSQLTALFTAAYAPIASFIGAPTNGFAPLAVTFTDLSSGNITNRHWIFGDGGTLNTTATTVSHTYNAAGTNTVTLIVSGPSGAGTNMSRSHIVAANVMPPLLSSFTSAGTNLVILGFGTPAATYGLFGWTNLLMPPSGVAATGVFDPVSGVCTNLIFIQPTNPAMFFRLKSPYP